MRRERKPEEQGNRFHRFKLENLTILRRNSGDLLELLKLRFPSPEASWSSNLMMALLRRKKLVLGNLLLRHQQLLRKCLEKKLRKLSSLNKNKEKAFVSKTLLSLRIYRTLIHHSTLRAWFSKKALIKLKALQKQLKLSKNTKWAIKREETQISHSREVLKCLKVFLLQLK